MSILPKINAKPKVTAVNGTVFVKNLSGKLNDNCYILKQH